MRNKIKITIQPRYVLAACSVLCLVLIILSFKYEEQISPVKTAVGTVMTPMQKGINSVGQLVSDKIRSLKKMKKLQEENEALQQEVDELEYNNKILQKDKYELDNLRELYDLDSSYADYPKVAAHIISKDSGNWFEQFTIDKGSQDGIEKDMNVIAGAGLVGLVYEVGENYSKVRSIIDDKSNISGMFLETNETCIVEGNLATMEEDGYLPVEMIDKESEVKEGYEVVTSRVSSKFLPGILIGTISNLQVDSTNMTMTGELKPAVDFTSLNMVLVITELKVDLPDEAYMYDE
jgi:rod shape-determining protein MreC